ncbi:sulfite exporter TauE/SafE family protein [Aliamphritea hakodatensis]|uniref:sulfite exporter TauE/SafE family protein n=1 Tax=Aliamphritea hakodatensis TaxID=2895352 RepID=UPI0022FD54F0|nr:sulfite exporter TauE/SafE family protein [Aliamphritea hakodatensis]
MDLITLLVFTGIIAFATYVQTVTGFALGMIVMGTVTAINLVPIAFTAVVISAVTLINGLFALKGNLRAVDWRKVMLTTAGILPGVIAGLVLLDYMSEEFSELLQLLLGITIILGGLMIMLKPQPLEKPSPDLAFTASGATAGFLAGLFSMAGPPLVYLFYRQPFELLTIRLCLMTIFLSSSVARTAIVGIQGGLTWDMLVYSVLCIPVVMFFTWIGKRYPPPLTTPNMRRLAFFLLIIIGVSLVISTF